jgi:hypothetical protein
MASAPRRAVYFVAPPASGETVIFQAEKSL